MNDKDSNFSLLRSFFWPIRRYEVPKLLPMLLILFLIALNQSILRNTKDTIVITAKSSGAEVIPFIKVWAMLPMAVLSTIFYTKLVQKFSQDKTFYIIISCFIVYFFIFGFFIFPNQDLLRLDGTADYLASILPKGLAGFIAMIRNWSFTLFYAMCEIWGSIVLTVLFWGFANEVTKISEAPRFYTVLGIAANFSAIAAGKLGILLTSTEIADLYFGGASGWDSALQRIIALVVFNGCLAMLIFKFMRSKHLADETDTAPHIPKKKKQKISIKESLKYLAQSRYIMFIAVLVLGYNLTINLVEVIWKHQLKLLYPSPVDYNNYINQLTMYMGITSTLSALFLPGLLKVLGWTPMALLTPLIMFITSLIFFVSLVSDTYPSINIFYFMTMSPLAISVFVGGLQNCLSKAMKYSAFDTTKEMVFIPLPSEWRLKGKAAIDGVGSRLGKSSGSFIHQVLLLLFSSLTVTAPIVGVIVIFITSSWMYSTICLGKLFKDATVNEILKEDATTDNDSKALA